MPIWHCKFLLGELLVVFGTWNFQIPILEKKKHFQTVLLYFGGKCLFLQYSLTMLIFPWFSCIFFGRSQIFQYSYKKCRFQVLLSIFINFSNDYARPQIPYIFQFWVSFIISRKSSNAYKHFTHVRNLSWKFRKSTYLFIITK